MLSIYGYFKFYLKVIFDFEYTEINNKSVILKDNMFYQSIFFLFEKNSEDKRIAFKEFWEGKNQIK